jgi:very-short-patch-repair endonuclease
MMVKYGVTSALQSSEIREKVKQTNLEKYGVDNPSQSLVVKEQKRKTTRKNHGVDHPLQSREIREKIKQTNLEKYGVDNPLQSSEIKEKVKQTNLERYGAINPQQSPAIIDKTKKTNRKRYGHDYPSQSPEVKTKTKQTNIERYGVECTLQVDVVKEKIKATNIERHGVAHPAQSPAVQTKTKQTNQAKYGVDHARQAPEVRETIKKTMWTRYGVNFYAQRHIPKETLDILNNREALSSALVGNNFTSLGERLGVCAGTVARYAYKHGLECPTIQSFSEIEISEFLTANAIKHERGNRSVIKPKELDFWLPDHNLAIEFNGIYWHSSKFKDKDYHLNKTLACSSQGVQLLHIFEDEWVSHKESLKKKILHLCGKTEKVIGARKLNITECSEQGITTFIDDNHVQGSTNAGTHNLKVTHNNSLVAAVVLTKTAVAGEVEMVRFCTDQLATYPGLMSKVVSFVKKTYHYHRMISFADLRLSNGDVFRKSGWREISRVPPDYQLVLKNTQVGKSSDIGDSDMLQIYDCGKIEYMIEW